MDDGALQGRAVSIYVCCARGALVRAGSARTSSAVQATILRCCRSATDDVPAHLFPASYARFLFACARGIIIAAQTPRLDLVRGGERPRPGRGVNRPPRAVTRCHQTSSPVAARAFNVLPAKVRNIGQDTRYRSPCTAYRRRTWSDVGYRGRGGPAHARKRKT